MRDLAKEFEELVYLFRDVFGTENGKQVLEAIKEKCQFDIPQEVRSHEQYAYLAGMRDVYIWCRNLAEMQPDEIQLRKENIKKGLTHGSL